MAGDQTHYSLTLLHVRRNITLDLDELGLFIGMQAAPKKTTITKITSMDLDIIVMHRGLDSFSNYVLNNNNLSNLQRIF